MWSNHPFKCGAPSEPLTEVQVRGGRRHPTKASRPISTGYVGHLGGILLVSGGLVAFQPVWGESQAVSDGVVGVLGAFCCSEGVWFGYSGALKPTVGVTVGAAGRPVSRLGWRSG